MSGNCCRSCLGFLLKILNFLHAFFGVSLTVYAVWVLNHWIRNGGTLDLDRFSDLWFVLIIHEICLIERSLDTRFLIFLIISLLLYEQVRRCFNGSWSCYMSDCSHRICSS